MELDTTESYKPRIFSFNGRIGRMRYLAYSFGTTFIAYFVIGMVMAIVIPVPVSNGLGVFVPLILIAVLAAIAKPAYQDFLHRA